ncbi:MAG TPA: hypothetical protein VLK34_10310 [Nocardioidaceae bacterium]|nr:hypothetical protein [Nocardioidaceae bacterium]
MSTTTAPAAAAATQTIAVTSIAAGALEFITARLEHEGGSVQMWEFPTRGVTEIGFSLPSDPKGLQTCRKIVAEWCAANFPGVPVMSNVQGRHRRG